MSCEEIRGHSVNDVHQVILVIEDERWQSSKPPTDQGKLLPDEYTAQSEVCK